MNHNRGLMKEEREEVEVSIVMTTKRTALLPPSTRKRYFSQIKFIISLFKIS